MDTLYDLLGCDVVCEHCGRRHRLNVREVHTDADALTALPDIAARYGSGAGVALLADTRTYEVAGRASAAALRTAGHRVRETIVPDPAPGDNPVCDDLTRDMLEERLNAPGFFVAVGSGVISDLTKWIAGDRAVPYAVVATAASMNGYASDNIAPTIRGVKSLLDGTGPVAVLTAVDILATAPPEMTASGLGDVLAKPVSASDWRLNKLLFDAYYCPFCADLINDIEPVYMNHPEAIGARTPAGLRALFDALIFTGLSMSMAGTSAPASGGEHLISHTLDMMSMLDGTPHDLHGRQVGVGTIFGAALYERVLAVDTPVFHDPGGATDASFWRHFTDAVEEEHAGKRGKNAAAVARLCGDPSCWEQVRETLAPGLRSPAVIKDCLARAGAAHRLVDIGVERERFMQAVHHAHEIRERFTILDLARCTGVLPEQADAIVDEWLV